MTPGSETSPTTIAGVFVYGTLKSGERNSDVVQVQNRRAARLARGLLYHLPAPRDFPVLDLETAGAKPIRGELLHLAEPRRDLQLLDWFEGCSTHVPGGLYTRSRVLVELDDGSRVEAWVYHLDDRDSLPADAEPVPDGRWTGRGA